MPTKNANLGVALDVSLDAVTSRLGDVPAILVEDAAAASADFLLCALITRLSPAEDGRERRLGGEGAGSPVWWTGAVHRAETAAEANLLAGIAADFDAVHYLAGGHLAAFLAPALLGRRDLSVAEALRLQAVATEFAVRVGQVIKDRARANGFHVTPLVGGLSMVYALALADGHDPDRVKWCLRLFLSTFRSDYGLLGSDGRLYQMTQAMRQAYAAVAEGGAHARPDLPSARAWWRPLAALGIPLDSPDGPSDRSAGPSDRWISSDRFTDLKPMPCCAYFFSALAVVAGLRGRLDTGAVRRLEVRVPRYVFAAHRPAADGFWLAPFDLDHNIAICWLLRRNSWTPLPELTRDEVRRMRELVHVHVVSDDLPVTAVAVTEDGTEVTATESADTPRPVDGTDRRHAALWQKHDTVRRRLGPDWSAPRTDEGAERLLRDLLAGSAADVRGLTAGLPLLNGALQ
ncbi:hypothetical protein GCM10017674_23280 [Streptomyces gardneri]|uniref:MmgE/PrpD family protein n=1 Tax=Streptomyces gardneri TaxID=66892 RepID=A0A4Y3RVR8_9ACTN|nr:hypothetical protein SGA01_74010 [Streptomyces gardneri]GHG93510.1 hypothetical protein GCM10017674_23280 [Streptomyces gardneri]